MCRIDGNKPDFHGTDSFLYRAFDGFLYSDPATVNIDVISINDASIASDDLYACDAGSYVFKNP